MNTKHRQLLRSGALIVLFLGVSGCASTNWVKLDNSAATAEELKIAKTACGDVDAELKQLDREKEAYIENLSAENPEGIVEFSATGKTDQNLGNFSERQNSARLRIKKCMGRHGLKYKR